MDADWVPMAWFIISELTLLYFIRDGLVLIVVQLVFKNQKIKAWQKELLDEKEKEKQKQKQKTQ